MVMSIFSPAMTSGLTPIGQRQRLAPDAEEAKQKIYAETEGRAQELANDPYQKSAMDYLQGVVGGKNVPYTDEVKNSILAQQGAGASAAEAAQMQSLRDSLGATGGSIYDPGYQAAQREAMSQRQGSALDAQGQLNAKAGVENAQAQMAGAGQLAAARGAQNAQINQMDLAGAGYRAQTQVAVPTTPQAQAQPAPFDPFARSGNQQNSVSEQNRRAVNGYAW